MKNLSPGTYFTLEAVSEGQYREKGSKFLGIALPVASKDMAKGQLKECQAHYPEANHHCYALAIGTHEPELQENDDGEPKGSAGRPILNAIRSYGITNVLLIVVRYFGGKKLGKRGLIDAYRTTAERALDNGKIVEERITSRVHIEHAHDVTGQVQALIRKYEGKVKAADYKEKVTLELDLPRSLKGAFLKDLQGVRGSTGKDPERGNEG